MRLTRNLGMVLLGVWLLISGLVPLLGISVPALGTVTALLAALSGALLLWGR